MQVETSTATTSSPLSSLVPSSVPSIEPVPTVAGARAKVTYGRKPLATEHDADADTSRVSAEASSSSPPSDGLFDSPMRSYGRSAASRAEPDANDVTVTTEVSPATTAHAANSAIKLGSSSLFRRVDSQPSQHSDNDDDDHQQSTTDSPAVHRTKKFKLGLARAIFDSDSDSDADAVRSKPAASTHGKDHDRAGADDDDDDAIIARIRAQAVRDTDSDPFTGSLSSVPPSSSQAQSSSHRPSTDSGDEQMAAEDGSITLTRRRGAKISAMRGKSGNKKQSKFSSSSDQEAGAASDDDDVDNDHVQARKPRTFKLASSASSASAPPADQGDAQAGPSVNNATTLSRRERMDALAAAKSKKAHGEPEADVEASAQADPLLDAFFGGGSPGRIPSRSPSLDIQGSDDDEHNDAMPAFMAPNSENIAMAKAKSKSSKKKKGKAAATERDILSDLEGDFDRANAKVASKRAAATKEKAQPKVKPLSKKELESMHRQTARLARENRTRLAPTHQKKTIGLNELLSKIQASEAVRNGTSHTASPNTSADTASDGSAQPSSQIPSGQSKSQHASDPIESDPIPDRSSPHPNYSSSPVVPMSRQQERRLGLDPSTSHANFLQTTAVPGRVGGLATKQDQTSQAHKHLLAQASEEEDDDAQLPDLASIVKQSRDQKQADKEEAQKLQRLRDMKLRYLEKSRQQPSNVDSKEVKPVAQVAEADNEDLELYVPGSVLAAKHNIPATPGKKRPTDLLYREIGIRPGKTPPSRKSYTGTNAQGSPNAVLHNAGDAENADGHDDDLLVTDSQLRSAGKGLFIASDKAAGHVPATQPPPASAHTRQDDSHNRPSATQVAGRAGPPKMTQAQLNATLMRKMQTQSIKARSQADAKNASAKTSSESTVDRYGRSAAPDVNALLKGLGEAAKTDGQDRRSADQDEDEDVPDYIMPPARDAESVIGSDIDMGSASEIEPADENEDFVDMDSADEDDEDRDIEQAGVRDTIEDADEEHDSEKENAPPPASQQSQRSNASPSLSRSLLPSRAVMDDDEDEMPAARLNARRGRRSALADDDDDDDEGDEEADENPLQPGPFEGSRGTAHTEEASQSQGRVRVPLGDISSQSIDQSMPFSPSHPSSAAFQPAHSPSLAAAAAPRRDPLVVPLSAGQDEDESFRTDDIPSQAADLGRFFEPTMPPPSVVKAAAAASQAPKSFWDQTQTQTQSQSQSQDPSQLPPSTRPPQATEAARPLVRDASVNSALGAFFQDTQQEELRGESLDIFDNHKVAGGKAPGYTQFNDGTPLPFADGRGNKGASSVWDASTMPPPKSTEVDAFAALRKAQMGEAMDFLDPTPSVLPSFDESQAEREAYAQAQANGQMANRSPEKMYMNRDGFFTQTKPSQQMGLWSQYDTQSQSQSQHATAGTAAGAWQSPAAPRASIRRDSDMSHASADHKGAGSDEEEEEEAPVQLKRLRRGVARFADEEVAEQQQRNDEQHRDDADSEVDDENGPPSSQPEPKPRNAFDVLRQGPIHAADDDEPVVTSKKRKSDFIEGEAEESEDEELGGQKRGDGGGLNGVFGDDNGSASGGDEDEDDEDDANAEDLQELVDNERELDEAEKDEVARARFREDMEAKDREELEIHQKAIQGGYRNRRGRSAGLNGIEGFLDEDADDEELKRRAAMGSHATMSAWKKRKLDGNKDGMDALATHEEAQAFVNSYAATHRIDHESEKYEFLAMAAEDQEGDEDGESGDDDEEDADEGDAEKEAVEEDAFGPVVTKQPRTIRYHDIARAVRKRKKAKKRSALDDDEDQEEEQERDAANGWDSDEDNTEARLATAMHDRIKGTQNLPSGATQPKRKPQPGAQYGRNAPRGTATAASHRDDDDAMDIDVPDHAEAADDDDDDTSSSLIARLMSKRPPARPSGLRSAGSSMAVDTLEDAEPEWGNDANIVRAPKPTASSNAGSQTGASRKMAPSPFAVNKAGKDKKGGSSMLLSKEGIMRRESGFSSSSSGSR